jgi:large subunit ribosomal protein L18
MSVRFTGRNIYVQFVDDQAGRTVASASTRHKSLAERETFAANVRSAERLGSIAAQAAINSGITRVVFDRSGSRYHGKVKALADAARAAGLKF